MFPETWICICCDIIGLNDIRFGYLGCPNPMLISGKKFGGCVIWGIGLVLIFFLNVFLNYDLSILSWYTFIFGVLFINNVNIFG